MHAPRVFHADVSTKTVKGYINWWTRYWGIPNKPKVKFDKTLLQRYNALGLYFPSSQTIVMSTNTLRGIADVQTLEVELRHHANPIEKHEGEF